MSPPTQKPDLDESINVTEAHDRMLRESVPAAREHSIADNGREPVSLGIVLACGFVLLIAGAVLGDAGTLFSYKSTFRDGYVRTSAAGAVDSGPKPKPALDAYLARGAKIYPRCGACHGPDAKGDGANFPSLVGSAWVTGDTQTLAMIIIHGLVGPTSTGKTYGGAGGMLAQGGGMPAEDLAGVMTYLRNSHGNSTGDVVTVEMAQAAIDLASKREKVGQVTAEEIAAAHATALPGSPLDPTLLVDPKTLVPIAVP